MTIITFLIVAIWWNPYAIVQNYFYHAEQEAQRIEETKK
jgi:hypothetical protein